MRDKDRLEQVQNQWSTAGWTLPSLIPRLAKTSLPLLRQNVCAAMLEAASDLYLLSICPYISLLVLYNPNKLSLFHSPDDKEQKQEMI